MVRGLVWAGALTLFLGTVLVPTARAQDVDLSGLGSHPRLLLTPAVRAAIRAEAASGPKVAMFAEIKRRADSYLTDPPAIGAHIMMTLYVTSVAFESQQHLDRAIENFNYSVERNFFDSAGVDFALMYDWIYNDLTPAERSDAMELALDNYALGSQRTCYYNLEANEATGMGITGLTFYGDGTASQNSFCQEMVDAWDGRMRGVREFAYPGGTAQSRGGVLPTREKYFGDGGYYKGNQYGQKDIHSVTISSLLFEELGLAEYWDLADAYTSGWPEYMFRLRRPDDMAQRLMSGTNYTMEKRGWMSLAILNTYRQNSVASWWLNSMPWDGSMSGGYNWSLPAVLWRPGVPQTNPTTFPLEIFYGNDGPDDVPGKSYHEKVTVRSGWNRNTDNDDVFFSMHAGDFFGDYHSFYQLAFELYYRGALAVRAGFYEGGSDQREYYYNRAVSNNVVVVLDPTQSHLGDIWGQDFLYDEPGRPQDINDTADSPVYDTADIVSFEAGEAASGTPYHYTKGILNVDSAYYYTNNTRRVARQEREAVLMGRHLIVRDRVELSGGSNSVRFLLQTIHEPTIENAQLLETTVAGHIETYAQTRYTALRSGTVSGHNYDGKISVQPVLPVGSTLRKVGGEGYECWVDDGEGNGQNFPVGDPAHYQGTHEAGSWRVETIAPTALETDFVNAIFVGRPNQNQPAVRAIDDDSSVGCEVVGVGVFVFARTEENQDAIDYEILGSLETIPHIIEGLTPNPSYAVQINEAQPVLLTASHSGGLTFETAGACRIEVQTLPVASAQ